MGLVIKESIKSTITTFSGALLGLMTMIFSVKHFSFEEYGFYQTVIKNTSILAYVFILGFDYALLILGQRYSQQSQKYGAFLRYTMKIPLVFFIISCIIFLSLKSFVLEHIDAEDVHYYDNYFYYFPVITGIYLILYWAMGFLRSQNLSTQAYFVQDILIRIGNLILIALFAGKIIDFQGFMIGLSFSILVPTIWAVILSTRQVQFTWNKQMPLDSADKKYITEFAIYHMMVVIASMLIFHIDSFLFPYLSDDGLKDVGLFSLCLYVMSVLRMPLRVVGLSATPTMTKYYDDKDQVKLKELFGRAALNLQLLGSLMCVMVLINIEDIQWILNSWKPGYDNFVNIVPILIIGVWVELSLGFNFEMIGISKYYKYSFWISLFYLIISILLFILLVDNAGINGAAWAFTISLIIFSCAKSVFVMKKLQLSPFSKDTIKVMILSLFCLLTYFLPLDIHPFINIFVKIAITTLLFVIISLKWSIGEDIEHIYRKLKDKIAYRRN